MPNPKEKRDTEQSKARDKTAKIVSGLVPGGASVYELFTALVKPLHERRFEDWVREVTMRLHRLETEGKINMEELSRNEEFNTIITKATLLAQQTHQKEKIEALRNVVVNSALNLKNGTELFDWTIHFLHIIDRISPLHILLLKTFRNPFSEIDRMKINLRKHEHFTNAELFFKIYPGLKHRSALTEQCWKELRDYGLLVNEHFHIGTEKESIVHTKENVLPKVTDFGRKFLNMIEKGD